MHLFSTHTHNSSQIEFRIVHDVKDEFLHLLLFLIEKQFMDQSGTEKSLLIKMKNLSSVVDLKRNLRELNAALTLKSDLNKILKGQQERLSL